MADVHAAGSFMYFALTGQPPPPNATAALDPRTVVADIPASVANVVQRATNPSAALRPSNAMVLVVSLENAVKSLGGPAAQSEVAQWVSSVVGADHPIVQRMRTVLAPYGGGSTLPGATATAASTCSGKAAVASCMPMVSMPRRVGSVSAGAAVVVTRRRRTWARCRRLRPWP